MAERVQTVLRHLNPGSKTGHLEQNVVASPCSGLGVTSVQGAGAYRYTLDNPLLTKQQRDSYERDGFLVIRKNVPLDKLQQFKERFGAICQGDVKVPGMIVMKDVAIAKSEFVQGQKAITKIQDWQWDDVMFQYCGLPDVVKYVECFTGPNVMAMHTMLINKPPDPGTQTSRHPMHQDLHYFPFRPADRIVCAWTAMEKIHPGNGCLVVVPGTHKGELLEHVYPEWKGGVNKMYHGIKDYTPDQKRVHLEMEAGDTVFFHPILLHGSGTNRTTGFRKAISCHYAGSECEYIDVADSTQSVIEEEIREIIRKRHGSSLAKSYTMKDVWHVKGRLVKGEEVNL